MKLTLSNLETEQFLKLLKLHSEDMKEYRPLSSQATATYKYTVIMAGTALHALYLRLYNRYERYKSKPNFSITPTRGEISAIMVLLNIKPCPDQLRHRIVVQIGPHI